MLAPNLRAADALLLETLEVPGEAIAREVSAMETIAFGRSTNRRALGSMNDLAFQASVHLARGEDLPTVARRLAETPDVSDRTEALATRLSGGGGARAARDEYGYGLKRLLSSASPLALRAPHHGVTYDWKAHLPG
jgi:hypothetical protein